MDQPFSGLAKELFEAQHYPQAFFDASGKPEKLPYDVTGWTLPMQMGVRVDAVTDPVGEDQRSALELVSKIDPLSVSVEGAGPTFILSHKPDASFMAVNDILAAGGSVAFSRDEVQTAEGPETGAFVVTGMGREKLLSIAQKYGVGAVSTSRNPQTIAIHKARVGLYRPWAAVHRRRLDPLDPRKVRLHAPRASITPALKPEICALASTPSSFPTCRRLSSPMASSSASSPANTLAASDTEGVANLRDFVRQGGTLVAFNQTSSSLIDLFGLPVTNILAGVKPDEFFCSGALLRIELKDASRPSLYGLPADPIVMFERGPAFAPKPGFAGAILATYPAGTNPLAQRCPPASRRRSRARLQPSKSPTAKGTSFSTDSNRSGGRNLTAPTSSS